MRQDIFQREGEPSPVPQNSRTAPIADLSYRGYNGPLQMRLFRWWIVALAGIRLIRKKPAFWVLTGLAAGPYLFAIFILYLTSRFPMPERFPFIDPTVGQKYAFQFFQAFDMQLFPLLLVALMAGAGSIAADNQTNALLIYLSKPITKGDYLLGKWMGVFLVVYGVAAVPAFILYLYCLLSYTSSGFLKEEPWLFLRFPLACALPAAVYASLLVGISAWSKTPRMAGAIVAGLYFATSIIAGAYWGIRYHGNIAEGIDVRHASLSGALNGIAQHIYGVTLHITRFRPREHLLESVDLSPPTLWPLLAITTLILLGGVVAARLRIRAVEVVSG
jgi:ABC-2 type transport system permease protein